MFVSAHPSDPYCPIRFVRSHLSDTCLSDKTISSHLSECCFHRSHRSTMKNGKTYHQTAKAHHRRTEAIPKNTGINTPKVDKDIGLDSFFTEGIKHFGRLKQKWILELTNNRMLTKNISKIWI